jgi:uncharacterized phosphatase
VLALVRHGETDWNSAGRLQGRTDIPLNDLGRRQANDAGAALAAQDWDLLVSSPLRRAVETAEIIGSHVGLDLSFTVPDLIERDFRGAEGSVLLGMEREDIDKLLLVSESEAEVAARSVEALQQLVRENAGRRIIAVAHGTLIRVTMGLLRGEPHAHVLNCETIELEPELLMGFEPEAAIR